MVDDAVDLEAPAVDERRVVVRLAIVRVGPQRRSAAPTRTYASKITSILKRSGGSSPSALFTAPTYGRRKHYRFSITDFSPFNC